MNYAKLSTLGQPCFYLVEAEISTFEDLCTQIANAFSGAVVRKIRGRKCTSVSAFFDEVGAALQFPYYFGENWNAFDECIADLDWLEAPLYALMVSDAMHIVRNWSKDEFQILLGTFSRANLEWVNPNQHIPRNRRPTPFHVILHCGTADMVALSQRLRQSGLVFELL